MISVIIPALDAAEHLPRTLAPLVHGVAAGVVRQVIVADGGSSDDTRAIADAAGCDWVDGGAARAKQLRAGVAAAKGKWLLFLHPDTILDDAWVGEAERFMAAPQARMRAGVFKLGLDDDSGAARRALFWSRLRTQWLKAPRGDQGLLISRFLYDALGGYADLPAEEDVEFIRRIGPARLVLLKAEAVTRAANYVRS